MSPDAGVAEVTVGERSWSKSDIDRLIANEPALIRIKYAEAGGRAAFVDRLIESELLLQEARRRGIDQQPEVKAAADRVVVQALAAQLASDVPDEAELRKVYEASREESVRPDRLHVRAVLYQAQKGSPGARRAALDAQAALSKLLAVPAAERDAKVAALARTRAAGFDAGGTDGDLGPRTGAELEELLGAGAQKAQQALKVPGDLVALETEKGTALILLRGVQPGFSQSFEAARPRLEQDLIAQRRAEALRTLLERLKAETRVSR